MMIYVIAVLIGSNIMQHGDILYATKADCEIAAEVINRKLPEKKYFCIARIVRK